MLYGSVVWGAYIYKLHNNVLNVRYTLEDVNNMFEKLHIKMCKQTLQVNRRASNYAVRFELGRLPMIVNVICNVLKYFINLRKRKDASVGQIALKLHILTDNSWFNFVKVISEILGFDLHKITGNSIKNSKNSVFKKLKQMCQNTYRDKIVESSKLILYSDIKFNLVREKYLQCSNPSIRKAVTEIRISCHKLPVELGRHNNVNKENRLCNYCKYEIGDEKHYFMYCFHPTLSKIRNEFIKNILKINPSLKSLDRGNLFKYNYSVLQ
jgi:hypothetical protein